MISEEDGVLGLGDCALTCLVERLTISLVYPHVERVQVCTLGQVKQRQRVCNTRRGLFVSAAIRD